MAFSEQLGIAYTCAVTGKFYSRRVSKGSGQLGEEDETLLLYLSNGDIASLSPRPTLWQLPKLRLGCPCPSASVQSLSRVRLFVTPWTAACQASLSITNSQRLLKLIAIKSVMPSNHLILYCPLLLLPSFFPSISLFQGISSLN